MRFILAIISILIFTGCTTSGKEQHIHDAFTKHFENSLFTVSDKGMFSVEMVIKEHELRTGVNAVDVIIHDRQDRDVVGAEISVVPWMPEMGHGVFEKPVITEKGGGLYTVENVILIMSGHWELRVGIVRDGIEDSAVFDFPDVKIDRGHDHKSIKSPAPSDLDLAVTRMSDKGVYRVTYKSDVMPVPVNRIHGWTLRIASAEGAPVKDAEISIDGDMPEHGHGMPTQPQVTQELEKGEYLVEGMKFSMPGWWVMTFTVRTIDSQDRVTFNLLLRE